MNGFCGTNWLKISVASIALLSASPAWSQETSPASIETVFATRAYTSPPSANKIVVGDDGVAVDAAAHMPAASEPLDRPDMKMGGGASITADPVAGVKTYSREEIMLAVQTEAEKVGVDPRFAFALATMESDFDQFAVSEDGAVGVMQLMPGTAAELGVTNSYDAMQNIRGGVSYLAQLQAEFRTPLLVAAAYHSGAQAVRDAQGIPQGPRVAAYTVRLLNEYYQIFQLQADPVATAALAAPVPSGMKPIAKPRRAPAARASSNRPAEGGLWEAGFVMNLE